MMTTTIPEFCFDNAEALEALIYDADAKGIDALPRCAAGVHQLVRVRQHEEGMMGYAAYQTALMDPFDVSGTASSTVLHMRQYLSHVGHDRIFNTTEALLRLGGYATEKEDDRLVCWRVFMQPGMPLMVKRMPELVQHVAQVSGRGGPVRFEPMLRLLVAHGIRPGHLSLMSMITDKVAINAWIKIEKSEQRLLVRMSTVAARHIAIARLCGSPLLPGFDRHQVNGARVKHVLGEEVAQLRDPTTGDTLVHTVVRLCRDYLEYTLWTTFVLAETPLFARDNAGRRRAATDARVAARRDAVARA